MTKKPSFTHKDLQAYYEKRAAAEKIKVGDLHAEHAWARPVTAWIDAREDEERRRSNA